MKKNIIFVGLTGCGKSTIGKLLAKRLKATFIDTDTFIEEKEGKTISQIFAEEGEAYFRQQETAAAQELSTQSGLVIATGGGIVLNPENIKHLKKNGVVIFLDRTPDAILKKINIKKRPLLAENPNVLYDLDRKRRHLYEAAADYHLIILSGIDDTLREVLTLLREKNIV